MNKAIELTGRPRRVFTDRWLSAVLILFVIPAVAQELVPDGPFTDAECIVCHETREPGLVKDWRNGPHGSASGINCTDCHGDRHGDSLAAARRNQACNGCHQGPVNHSYTTSKHGVILRLEEHRLDWHRPLKRGNYRVPGCSYCHQHDNDHGDTMAPEHGPSVRQWICAGCHSPRYVREQFDSGRRQQEIAELKVTEGEGLLSTASTLPPEEVARLRKPLLQHLRNVRLGVGHQSPDYQWWHGQPALDGDLIRIRDRITQARRLEAVNNTNTSH